jgi:hypothetical protein
MHSLQGHMISLVAPSRQETPVEHLLRSNGLLFDPFITLEASADPHLSSYFIGHEAFSVVWGNWNSIIFAPAGGGKTALRARVVQSCWVGQETNRPFPITYIPPYLKWGHAKPTPEQHLESIAQSGAAYLLLALAHRPHWFLRLNEIDRNEVSQALAWNLSGPISRYLGPCRATNSLNPLRAKFSPIELPPDPPDAKILSEFFHFFDSRKANEQRPEIFERWNVLRSVLLNILRFPSIYIQIDGLDATQDMVDTPKLAGEFFNSLTSFLQDLNTHRIYLKTYIPIETKEHLQKDLPEMVSQAQITTIEWTPPLLAEMVRRRIYVASEGTYGSLGPLSSPEIRDPEIELAKAVFPLPREMLVLTRQVFIQICARNDQNPKITSEDLRLAVEWYRQNNPFILL